MQFMEIKRKQPADVCDLAALREASRVTQKWPGRFEFLQRSQWFQNIDGAFHTVLILQTEHRRYAHVIDAFSDLLTRCAERPVQAYGLTFPNAHQAACWVFPELAFRIVLSGLDASKTRSECPATFDPKTVVNRPAVFSAIGEFCREYKFDRVFATWLSTLIERERVFAVKAAEEARYSEPAKTGKRETVNERMKKKLIETPEAAGWSAQEWADALGIRSKGTVAATATWDALKGVKAQIKLQEMRRKR
jgi:hypothetical protein